MLDKYKNFAELSAGCELGVDYRIRSVANSSRVLAMAIHGGGIERGSGEIARLVSKVGGYNFYEFAGIRRKGNLDMHLTATNFDEESLLGMLKDADRVLSFHGVRGDDEQFLMLGGLDNELRESIADHLNEDGYDIRTAKGGLGGVHAMNVVNRGRTGMGVQLELSKAMRTGVMTSEAYANHFASRIKCAVDAVLERTK